MDEITKFMNGMRTGLKIENGKAVALAEQGCVTLTGSEMARLYNELTELISDYNLLKDYAERQFKAYERRMNEND